MNSEKLYLKYGMLRKKATQFRSLELGKMIKDPKIPSFATNDYLGLSTHPNLIEAAHRAAQTYGVGATGSRLLSGNSDLFVDLETQIAMDKKTQAALLFHSGFQANVSVLSSLLDKKTLGSQALVFFDKSNHASLYQGVFLSGADLIRYRHNDMDHLGELLTAYKDDSRPKFIITETVFGMDGDLACMGEILSYARTSDAFLYLDEAHATGLFGPQGFGLSTEFDFSGLSGVIMGTFSKALGTSGAYIACSQITKDYLVNHSPGFIYSTALSPMVVGAAGAAWRLLPTMNEEREKLMGLATNLRDGFRSFGFDVGLSSTHIVTVMMDTEKAALAAKEVLAHQGIDVSAVRPPTVPSGSSRLRLAVTAHHQEEDIKRVLRYAEAIKRG